MLEHDVVAAAEEEDDDTSGDHPGAAYDKALAAGDGHLHKEKMNV